MQTVTVSPSNDHAQDLSAKTMVQKGYVPLKCIGSTLQGMVSMVMFSRYIPITPRRLHLEDNIEHTRCGHIGHQSDREEAL